MRSARLPGLGRDIAAAFGALQGALYLASGLQSLGSPRRAARARAAIEGWPENAQGAWQLVVGATLLAAALQEGPGRGGFRILALGSAIGIAANDAVSAARGEGPLTDRSDLAFELAIVGAWVVRGRQLRRG
jgi:hypothetical protein